MLNVKSLRVLVAGKPVVDDLSFTLNSNEIVGLIGAPGCGKSTLLNAIFGLARIDAGDAIYRAERLNGSSPQQNINRGVVLVPQGGRVFRTLTVEQNLSLAGYVMPPGKAAERITAIYEFFPRLAERRRQLAGLLSGGERQMLALGMGLIPKPQLLLLDEPSTGLSPSMTERMLDYIRQLSDQLNCGVLLVEQNVKNAVQISNRVLVMGRGRIVYTHDVQGNADHARLLDAYAFARECAAPSS